MPLDEVALLKQEIAVLRTQIAWLQQQLFGPGKSEKLDRAQLLLKLGELEKLAAASAPTQTITYARTVRQEKRPLPAENFAHLPVQETIELVPEVVRAEPEAYERIGEERTFEGGRGAAQTSSSARLCARSLNAGMIARSRRWWAPAPARAVAGGYASAGLLAWIALSKYVDHLPLYRLEQMSSRWGATLPRSSMADWIGITASGWNRFTGR